MRGSSGGRVYWEKRTTERLKLGEIHREGAKGAKTGGLCETIERIAGTQNETILKGLVVLSIIEL